MDNNFDMFFNEQTKQRDKLQELFDISFQENDKIKMREYYKRLRRLELESDTAGTKKLVDVSSLVENITIACDVLTSDVGVNFLFCGNKTSCITANEKSLTKAVLNLLSNAYLYGKESLVTVKVIEKDGFIRIEVQSGGTFVFRNGRGLEYVRKVCREHNGRLFIESDLLYSKVMMIFERSETVCDRCECVSFYDLIKDRLSPVYIELFGMEYN